MLFHKHNRWSLCGLASRAALAASSTVMKREVPAVAVATALMVSAAPAAGQVQQDAQSPGQTSSDTQREPRFVFSFDDHPSFRIGSKVRLDVRFKSQADWRDFPDEDGDSSNDTFDLHRARLGVEGRVSRYLEYQVEREIRDVKRPWRDVFVNVRPLRALEVQFGRFKMPFSLEQTTGSMDLNFAYRALAATYLAPSRDIGVMAHGDFLRNALKYEIGLFREGGDNARITEAMNPVSQRTIAGRVVTRPLVAMQVPALRDLEVGAAFTAGRVPEGLNSLRARDDFRRCVSSIVSTSTGFDGGSVPSCNGARDHCPFRVKSSASVKSEGARGSTTRICPMPCNVAGI